MKHTEKLLKIMADLRHPERGCPWDLEQDYKSIAPYTLEEAYEVADAINRNDVQGLKEELGDLLLQVVFLSQIAKEKDDFVFEDVAESIAEKLVRRHPHVFGGQDGEIKTSDEQTESWEKIKAEERKLKAVVKEEQHSVLDDVPLNLPSLLRGSKLQKRASKVGFDWENLTDIFDKLHEEMLELQEAIVAGKQDAIEDEMGDVLFTMVNIANHLKVNPETALRRTNEKFERRFRYVEEKTLASGKRMQDSTLEEMDYFWNQAKKLESAK